MTRLQISRPSQEAAMMGGCHQALTDRRQVWMTHVNSVMA